jgi:hypothetical protein
MTADATLHLARKNPPQSGDARYGRSRVTNGQRLLEGVDGRSVWVRRCKDLIAELLGDMGGVDNTSAAERSLIRRSATLTVELERLETRFATAGEATDSDLDLYQRTAGNLKRLLEAVGIHRRPKDVNPSLDDYLRSKAQARTIELDDDVEDAEVV